MYIFLGRINLPTHLKRTETKRALLTRRPTPGDSVAVHQQYQPLQQHHVQYRQGK